MTTTDTRDPDQIEREIRRTQNEMSHTVDQLGEQMSPRNLMNSLLDTAEQNGIDARYLKDAAARNPLALGLVAAGAIWLVSGYDAKPSAFTSDGDDEDEFDRDHYDYDPHHRGYVAHMSRVQRTPDEDDTTYLRRRDEARGTYLMVERHHDEDDKSYRDRLNEATDKMRERRDRLAESAHETRQHLARQGREAGRQAAATGRRAARRTEEAYYDNPLIGGLAAALIGAVAGGAAPLSRTEREQLGPTGAEAIDMAEDKAREFGEQARQKKDEAVEKADRKLEEQGSR
jgi:hypothetical protein